MGSLLLGWVLEALFAVARPVGAGAIGAWRAVTGRPVVPPSDAAEWFVGFAVIVAAIAGALFGLVALTPEEAPSLGAGGEGAP